MILLLPDVSSHIQPLHSASVAQFASLAHVMHEYVFWIGEVPGMGVALHTGFSLGQDWQSPGQFCVSMVVG